MEDEIRKLSKKARGDDSDEEPAKKKVKKSFLEEEIAKYSKSRGAKKTTKDKKKDEGDIMAALNSFRSKLKGVALEPEDEPMDVEGGVNKEEVDPAGGEENPGMEVDDDTGFLSHRLNFPKDNTEEVQKAERDYEVIDPRQRAAQAREAERERKRAMKPKDGGRGSRR